MLNKYIQMEPKSYVTLYRLGLLTVLLLLGVSMGCWQEIATPTLPSLKEKLNVSYESMGRLMSMRSIGNVMALLSAGYLYDSFPGYVPYLMFFECFIGGVCTIIIPWCRTYWLTGVLFFIQSGVQNALNNGSQLLILKTFHKDAIGKMQIFHLGYGIGGFLSGIISSPFLPKQTPQKVKITKYCGNILKSRERELRPGTINSTFSEIIEQGSFEYIYLISGLMAIVISFIFLFFMLIRNPDKDIGNVKKKELWIRKIHPKYTANGKICFGTTMTMLLFFYYFFYVFGLLVYFPYLVVYAIDPCKTYQLDQRTAAYLHSVANGCFLLGRIIGSFLSNFCATLMILSFNFCNIIAIFILLFFSNDNAVALWVGSCLMRFFNSVVYPTGTSYMNHFIIVTSTLISIAFLGDTLGVFSGQAFGGYLVDNFPSYYILYPCLGAMITLFIITILIIVLGKQNGVRDFSKEMKLSCINETE